MRFVSELHDQISLLDVDSECLRNYIDSIKKDPKASLVKSRLGILYDDLKDMLKSQKSPSPQNNWSTATDVQKRLRQLRIGMATGKRGVLSMRSTPTLFHSLQYLKDLDDRRLEIPKKLELPPLHPLAKMTKTDVYYLVYVMKLRDRVVAGFPEDSDLVCDIDNDIGVFVSVYDEELLLDLVSKYHDASIHLNYSQDEFFHRLVFAFAMCGFDAPYKKMGFPPLETTLQCSSFVERGIDYLGKLAYWMKRFGSDVFLYFYGHALSAFVAQSVIDDDIDYEIDNGMPLRIAIYKNDLDAMREILLHDTNVGRRNYRLFSYVFTNNQQDAFDVLWLSTSKEDKENVLCEALKHGKSSWIKPFPVWDLRHLVECALVGPDESVLRQFFFSETLDTHQQWQLMNYIYVTQSISKKRISMVLDRYPIPEAIIPVLDKPHNPVFWECLMVIPFLLGQQQMIFRSVLLEAFKKQKEAKQFWSHVLTLFDPSRLDESFLEYVAGFVSKNRFKTPGQFGVLVPFLRGDERYVRIETRLLYQK